MGHRKPNKFWAKQQAAACQNSTATQRAPQQRAPQPTYDCVGCHKTRTKDCFSKTALKEKDNILCRDCKDADAAVTPGGGGQFDRNTGHWVETVTKPNDEINRWDFEEGQKIFPATASRDVDVNNLFPRPKRMTAYREHGVVAALLTAATIVETPIGRDKFKTPNTPQKSVSEDLTRQTVPRHHKAILTEAMKKESARGGNWPKAERKTNIVLPQFARGGMPPEELEEPAYAGWEA